MLRRSIRPLSCALLLFGAAGLGAVQAAPIAEKERIDLWPAAGASDGGDRVTERSRDPTRPDRIIEDVRRPYLAVHVPAQPNGAALLVVPGGGYARVVLDKEGSALVPAFVDIGGVTLFVLHYRLPDRRHAEGADAPLADAQRALRIIRARARDHGIDPARIGVMGFSAGGHVAARLATHPAPAYVPVDAIDLVDARPDFALLIYPVISMRDGLAHAGSRDRLLAASDTPAERALARLSPERDVDARTPPLFLLHAQDDPAVPVGNALAMHAAALAAGVPASLHVFPTGGHGFGVRDAHGPLARWPHLALDWIDSLPPRP
ncbi:alpha/beta hydrolase [Luteimonas sp. TWI1416]|uniref:alpha/beta hydrolase n=1 Tax=unclassified Luteimonas TaxID=2629088 RepID=UPI00320B8C28